jgi:hypothetical protein
MRESDIGSLFYQDPHLSTAILTQNILSLRQANLFLSIFKLFCDSQKVTDENLAKMTVGTALANVASLLRNRKIYVHKTTESK